MIQIAEIILYKHYERGQLWKDKMHLICQENIIKKYKSKGFAVGCSREIIERGADMLVWELSELIEKTILEMRSCEESVSNEINIC